MHKAVGLFEKGVPGATQMGNDHAGCINWYFVTRLRRDAAVFVRRVRIVAVRIEFLRDSAIRFVQPAQGLYYHAIQLCTFFFTFSLDVMWPITQHLSLSVCG